MASVCGGCLALQDACVLVKRSFADIAMGLVLDTKEFGEDGTPLIIYDITGSEDASGDMDFKVLPFEFLLYLPLQCVQLVFNLIFLLHVKKSQEATQVEVAGNEDRITAFQMDIKVVGITLPIMKEAPLQANEWLNAHSWLFAIGKYRRKNKSKTCCARRTLRKPSPWWRSFKVKVK
ncbi:hypothetical protein LOK49_LG14G01748 [Camellia lanceoleosa]|uniref:Uncharacterized protein n=1 Tax=Camellia lanceoleosa TaxID=1840588 RepID=A0ACC0FDC2_9ERIC|nr:hypothetical protein LOK49_LG14G01748 [Camellia lanceoleosa]